MKLLDLSNPFEFTLRDQEGNETPLKGTFRTYTKKEQDTAKKKYDGAVKGAEEAQKIARKIGRLAEKIEIKKKLEDYKAVDELDDEKSALEDKLEALSDDFNKIGDKGLKERFDKCLGGDQREEILSLAEQVGYDTVYAKITEALQEGKSQD